MSNTFERATSGTLALAALIVAVAFAHREFAVHPAAAGNEHSSAHMEFLPAWQELVAGGQLIGDTAASIKIVEFADYACASCRQFETTMRSIVAHYGASVTRVFVDVPIPMQKFAWPAARTADCASSQGRFTQMHDVLFDKQDSLGIKSWASYAQESGVPDASRFAQCMSDTTRAAEINKAFVLARKVRLHMSPTIIVNGWVFPRVPSDSALSRVIDALRAGKTPTT